MNKVLIETSARHVHVSAADLAVLFGEGKELTVKKMLSQPGQFACEERVDIVGPKGVLKNVSILGPTRPSTQIEISLTDSRKLGIAPFVRESGDIEGTPGCKLIGPAGEVALNAGVIVAKRHVHLDPETAEKFGVEDKQIVQVKLDVNNRSLIFGDVVIRVNANFAPAMHIDTDEANAAAIAAGVEGEILA